MEFKALKSKVQFKTYYTNYQNKVKSNGNSKISAFLALTNNWVQPECNSYSNVVRIIKGRGMSKTTRSVGINPSYKI